MPFRTDLVPGFAIVVGACLSGPALDAAPQQPTFSSRTRLVTVAVSVLDRRTGAPVDGLTRADFQVYSDERPVPIEQFSNESGPVTIAVLMDASGSMAVNRAMTPAASAAAELLGDLTSADRAGVFSFDQRVNRRLDFAPVSPAHTRALGGLEAFGSTSLYDAVLATSRLAASDPGIRRAVVVFTDGRDTSSVSSPSEVRAQVAAIDVPLYIVALGAGDESHPLRPLAEDTGGHLYTIGPDYPMARARAGILNSLRRHYVLAFTPDTRTGWHPITVRTRGSHTVRTRAGYIVSPEGGTSCVVCL